LINDLLLGEFGFDEAGDIHSFLRTEAFIPGVVAYDVVKTEDARGQSFFEFTLGEKRPHFIRAVGANENQ
jgi:hypothetical protein